MMDDGTLDTRARLAAVLSLVAAGGYLLVVLVAPDWLQQPDIWSLRASGRWTYVIVAVAICTTLARGLMRPSVRLVALGSGTAMAMCSAGIRMWAADRGPMRAGVIILDVVALVAAVVLLTRREARALTNIWWVASAASVVALGGYIVSQSRFDLWPTVADMMTFGTVVAAVALMRGTSSTLAVAAGWAVGYLAVPLLSVTLLSLDDQMFGNQGWASYQFLALAVLWLATRQVSSAEARPQTPPPPPRSPLMDVPPPPPPGAMPPPEPR